MSVANHVACKQETAMISGKCGNHGGHVDYMSMRAECRMERIRSAAYTERDPRCLFMESICLVLSDFLLVAWFLSMTMEHRNF